MYKRRRFLKQSAIVGSLIPLTAFQTVTDQGTKTNKDLEFHIFSKHLQFLDYEDMAAATKEIGFDGVELAVRPKGHVEPEKVQTDLPRAIQAIKDAGLLSTMMVSGVNHVNDLNENVLNQAAELGVKQYRLGYYRYPKNKSIPQGLQGCISQFEELARLNQSLEIQGVYQNHAGNHVGASIWEIWQLLENTDQSSMGCQYDIRHAVVEGGYSWKTGLQLIHSRISSLVAKDFCWEKVKGKWKVVNVPIGEGMVDFVEFFKMIKALGIQVPMTVHYEYDLGGANHGDKKLVGMKQQEVIAAMKRDLEKLKELWQKA